MKKDRTYAVLVRGGGLAGLLLALLLGACGGGASPDSPPQALSLSGTAAVGAALAQAEVRARCLQGTASTRSDGEGRYSLSVPGGQLPCVLQVDGGDGRRLHGLAGLGSGSAEGVVANLTPLTEMVTVRVARGEAAAFFEQFAGSLGARLTRERLQAAQADVRTVLAGSVDLGSLADLLATPLQAAAPGRPGDAQDRLLDELASRLTQAQQGLLLAALASGAPAEPGGGVFLPWIRVQPQQRVLAPGATVWLMADINYPPDRAYIRQPVSWELLSAEGGSLDALSGRYTAPNQPGRYELRARRDDYPAVSATVTIVVPAYEDLERNAFSRIATAEHHVLRDPQAWAQLWARHAAPERPLPAIDFSQRMVLAVFLGSRPDGCHSVEIGELRQTAQQIELRYREIRPLPGQVCTQALTTPAHLVTLPASSLPVIFIEQS